jgi:hypothetical protein
VLVELTVVRMKGLGSNDMGEAQLGGFQELRGLMLRKVGVLVVRKVFVRRTVSQ